MMFACLQGLEPWIQYFSWKLPAAGVVTLFLSVKAAGVGRCTVPMPVELLAIERKNKPDSVNIATVPRGEKHIEKMKINEKIANREKRWATQLPTPSHP